RHHPALPSFPTRRSSDLKLLRFKMLHVPARLSRGGRRRRLRLPRHWPWAGQILEAFHRIMIIPPTTLPAGPPRPPAAPRPPPPGGTMGKPPPGPDPESRHIHPPETAGRESQDQQQSKSEC